MQPAYLKPTGCFSQCDRFSVWRVPVGISPGLFAGQHLVGIRERLRRDEAFERRQPMLVVTRAVVWRATIRRRLEFIGQRSRPLLPREVALFGKPDGEREGLGLPGLGKNGSAFVLRKRRQVSESLGIGLQIRRAQGSYPTCRCKPNRHLSRHPPKALA